jgi:hypothetical protein
VFCLFAGMLATYWLSRLEPRGRLGLASRGLGEVASLTAAVFIVFIFLRPIAQFIYFQF